MEQWPCRSDFALQSRGGDGISPSSRARSLGVFGGAGGSTAKE